MEVKRGRGRHSQQAEGLVATRAGLRQGKGATQRVSSVASVMNRKEGKRKPQVSERRREGWQSGRG